MCTGVADRTLRADGIDAIILDLDGVITRTAKVHAAAWKAMFDDYLARHAPAGGQYDPFDIESDYRRYVDGRPRYDGVRSFLESRGIELPPGDPGDAPDAETICGLGNRKNQLFREKLRSGGVEVYEPAVALVRALREVGVRTAVVSSSRNCRAVLEAAGIAELFDVRVDGMDLSRLELPGKPAPDMFIEASRRLDSDPHRTVGVEDATAGVQAAKAAGLGCVVGVDRGNQTRALRAHGADIVVRHLDELRVVTGAADAAYADQLPSALDHLDEIVSDSQREPALFLDYDGTLTPIVPHPDEAVLSTSMRATLRRLCGVCELAIVSGRDLGDVRDRVGIAGIWYAGSHGFDIAGPEGERTQYREGVEYLPALDAAEQALRDRLAAVAGCLVERKRFSIATHYRRVSDPDTAAVKRIVEEVHSAHPELRLSGGKKIYELQPAIEWHKGKAVRWLMQTQGMDPARRVPVYIGDDVTDEDAFRELAAEGVGILVAPDAQPTHATYHLDDPAAVELFLNRLGDALERYRT